MVDVFISYKREDRQRAQLIAKKLESIGFDIWIDSRIASGTAFDAEIDSALKQAKAVLVLWSPASVSSEWVRNEAMLGKERDRLVAIMLQPCELPIAFRSTQYEPLFRRGFSDDEPSWLRCVERLKDLTGRREENDRKQRHVLGRRRTLRSLSWLAAWPIGAIVITFALSYLLSTVRTVPPGPADFSATSWDDGYFYSRATVEIEGETVVPNHVEITCDRQYGYCVEARAELFDGTLMAMTDRRAIVQWDVNTIIARQDTPCASIVMTVDRATETVSAVRTRNPSITSDDFMCGWMNAQNVYRYVDGSRRAETIARTQDRYFQIAFWSAIVLWSFFVILRIVAVFRRN